jgi:hypothetical protein
MVLQARDSRDRTVSKGTTAGKIAEALIAAKVSYQPESPNFSDVRGGKANAMTNGSVDSPKGVNITLYGNGLKQSEAGVARTIIHEGAHGTREGAALYAISDRATFNIMHQTSFKMGSSNLYDNYDE